jgi:hypothetical protein
MRFDSDSKCHRWLGLGFAAIAIACCVSSSRADDTQIAADKLALQPLQAYVGEWKGVGLPKRGSNQGAWSETSDWAWHFAEGRAELVATLTRNKYFERLQVRPDASAGEFVVLATPVSKAPPIEFSGTLKGDELTATTAAPAGEAPARITVRLIAGGDRMLVLVEKRLSDDAFARLAEIGSTRKGSSFAKAAASGPECVVTGGLGTIAVEHEGKTYFVCCGGCRDLFNEDPAGVLADYRERKKAERAEKANVK